MKYKTKLELKYLNWVKTLKGFVFHYILGLGWLKIQFGLVTDKNCYV